MFARIMKIKAALLTAAAFTELQSCSAHRQKATGMIVVLRAQEQAQSIALKFARRNANAAELQDSNAQMDTNAD